MRVAKKCGRLMENMIPTNGGLIDTVHKELKLFPAALCFNFPLYCPYCMNKKVKKLP